MAGATADSQGYRPANAIQVLEQSEEDGEMIEDTTLRHRARELLGAGRLPRRRPDRIWGGSAFGGCRCLLCGALVGQEEVAMEVEYASETQTATTTSHLHTRCFLALELELLNLEAESPPPSAALVDSVRSPASGSPAPLSAREGTTR